MASKTTKKASTTDVEIRDDSTSINVEEPLAEAKPLIPKDVDVSQYVTVRNGFQGKLVYRSKRTGELFVWDEFGDEQDMELGELKNAKNSAKKFFINNWFMFDEPWIVTYLGMDRYYRYAVNIDEFDSLFEKKPAEVAAVISNLSDGQKRSLSYRARILIADGTIDSRQMISTLEKCLNTILVEQ